MLRLQQVKGFLGIMSLPMQSFPLSFDYCCPSFDASKGMHFVCTSGVSRCLQCMHHPRWFSG